MVVRIVSVKKDGTTTVQYHDPATNTYTKTQKYSSTKDAYSSSFYHAFDNTPAFYSPVEKKVDKSWVHSSHHSHSSSSSQSQNNNNPVQHTNHPQTPKVTLQQQQQPTATTNTQKETTTKETIGNNKPNMNSKYIIAGVIIALVVVAIYLKRKGYYGHS